MGEILQHHENHGVTMGVHGHHWYLQGGKHDSRIFRFGLGYMPQILVDPKPVVPWERDPPDLTLRPASNACCFVRPRGCWMVEKDRRRVAVVLK